jgi:2-keto-4-pentenoate hydratase/2-oxohepta-3-ene-1,7-dioic acid hydratase in catechol pathway
MRLITYDFEGDWYAGIVIEDKVVDASSASLAANILSDAAVNGINNRVIIQMTFDEQMQIEQAACDLTNASSSHEVHHVEYLHLGPPVPDPDKIICLGFNYRSHAEEADFEPPKIPTNICLEKHSIPLPPADRLWSLAKSTTHKISTSQPVSTVK